MQSFLAAYNKLWLVNDGSEHEEDLPRVGLGGRNCTRSIYYCALNTIFALGCEFAGSAQNTCEDSSVGFMDHVYDLLRLDILDSGDLAVVQTLLLVAIYLQSTQHPMRCWAITGLALRIAQGIGLNLEYHCFSSLEIEMRRRTWHGCMIMDA